MKPKLFMVIGTPESGWLIKSGPIYSIGINHLINTPNNLLNLNYNMSIRFFATSINTTTKEGYIAIQISSQTTKKKVSENPQLWTTISRKLLSCYETITFAPVQSQVLRNSRNWYNCKTFPIIISSIHHLQFLVHWKLFATNPSPQTT